MQIVYNHKEETVDFNTIKIGEVFLFNNEYYLRIQDNGFSTKNGMSAQALQLSTKNLYYFSVPTTEVKIIPATLTIGE